MTLVLRMHRHVTILDGPGDSAGPNTQRNKPALFGINMIGMRFATFGTAALCLRVGGNLCSLATCMSADQHL